jgi:hypothetical protein
MDESPKTAFGIGHNGGPPLEPFYDAYCPARFPAARTKRAKQNIAKKYRLPVIHIGHAALIDPVAGDNRLRELARGAPQPPRRGRPRTST